VVQIDGQPYDGDLVEQKLKGMTPYSITFNYAGGALRPGATIEVMRNFKSINASPVRLWIGQQGFIETVDTDGDACITFVDHPEKQWVDSKDFVKIKRIWS